MAKILIVDDVAALAEQYAYDLERVGGYQTVVANGGKEAIDAIINEAVDCVILDLEMPGVDGFEVLRTLQRSGIEVPVIVYTGTGDFDRCAQAIRLGAYGFIDKSEPMERVAQEVRNALERARMQGELRSLRTEVGVDTPLIGSSKVMKALKEQIARVAPIPSPVLVVGESGTGKELVARELHRLGADAKSAFVAINSAALPENLIESELFGHERGAFTGANRARQGAFERASGGTLFLDEIGDLPAQAQAKLLRVLESRQVSRVGGDRMIDVDARVVAATHRDLERAVEDGHFRQDLYFRLNVHIIAVPPLRDRRSDIPELANHLLAAVCKRFGVPTRRLDPATLDLLLAHDWSRNNVRELRNVIERMVIATDSDVIGPECVPPEICSGSQPAAEDARTFQELKVEAERRIIVAALERNKWHISNTAADLGLADHASLLKIMRRHDIKKR